MDTENNASTQENLRPRRPFLPYKKGESLCVLWRCTFERRYPGSPIGGLFSVLLRDEI